MPRVFGRRCPACGGALPNRPTGRPPTFCSKRCRQAVHRARQRAARAHAAAEAALTEARRLEPLLAVDVGTINGLLTSAHSRARVAAEMGRVTGDQEWQAAVPTDWEDKAAAVADRLAARAAELAAAIRAHARAAADQRRNLDILHGSGDEQDHRTSSRVT